MEQDDTILRLNVVVILQSILFLSTAISRNLSLSFSTSLKHLAMINNP